MQGRPIGLIVALTTVLALAGCAPAPAPARLDLTGDLQTHDPALFVGADGAPWYVFSTGDGAVGDGNIQIRRSEDGRDWSLVGTVWDAKPAWLEKAVPGVDNLWAPDIHEHAGTYYLYYAASTFGKNHSVIALATNTTLNPDDSSYRWIDRGPVLESTASDDFNAIDPGVVEDADGTPWMTFGSFWSGIRMVELEWPDGKRAQDTAPLRIGDRNQPPNAIEGATIVPHDGKYYLFVSRDLCCRGIDSTYNIAVGRADTVTGPYADRDGTPMLNGGGTQLLATEGARIGPGGQSVSRGYLAYHFYNGDAGGAFQLAVQKLGWDADGWPTVSH